MHRGHASGRELAVDGVPPDRLRSGSRTGVVVGAERHRDIGAPPSRRSARRRASNEGMHHVRRIVAQSRSSPHDTTDQWAFLPPTPTSSITLLATPSGRNRRAPQSTTISACVCEGGRQCHRLARERAASSVRARSASSASRRSHSSRLGERATSGFNSYARPPRDVSGRRGQDEAVHEGAVRVDVDGDLLVLLFCERLKELLCSSERHVERGGSVPRGEGPPLVRGEREDRLGARLLLRRRAFLVQVPAAAEEEPSDDEAQKRERGADREPDEALRERSSARAPRRRARTRARRRGQSTRRRGRRCSRRATAVPRA